MLTTKNGYRVTALCNSSVTHEKNPFIFFLTLELTLGRRVSVTMATMATQERLMTIGQVGKAAGVSAHTLRYYEKEGILSATIRNEAGYRFYDARAVERLRFLRSAQAVGFSLADIRSLLALDSENGKACQSVVQPMLENRIAEIDAKMKELKRVLGALGRALEKCRRSKGRCAVLAELRPAKEKSL
jgi:DNA-binding transcriptional MerR regulator